MEEKLPTPLQLAKMTGLTRRSAQSRLCKYRRGMIGHEQLMESREQGLERQRITRAEFPHGGGNEEFLSLGNKPREEALASIRGETGLEKKYISLRPRDGGENQAEIRATTALVHEIMQKTGKPYHAAYVRMLAYRRGDCPYEELFLQTKRKPGRKTCES